MPESNFIDYVKIQCRSGKGGAGSLHFHRAKYVPKGGPDGGDGGRGGHIILRGDRHMWTLLPLKFRRHIFAGDGQRGSENRSSGCDGEDIVINVPCGTVVYDADTGQYLAEVRDDGQLVKLLRGGRGGLGNWHFKSATNRTPRHAQPGEPGIEKNIVLELKLLADVGLVGFPNAGKSTLLSSVSAARPKIADYPFTTMEPQLGIVEYRDGRSFVMADIPGIIEGASEGRGLGLRFLRHIERNAVLLFMVPADADDITKQYEILLRELQQFNPQLVDKHRVLAVSKSDMLDDELMQAISETLPADVPHVFISAVTGQGITELKDMLWRAVTDDANRLATPGIATRDLDESHRDHLRQQRRLRRPGIPLLFCRRIRGRRRRPAYHQPRGVGRSRRYGRQLHTRPRRQGLIAPSHIRLQGSATSEHSLGKTSRRHDYNYDLRQHKHT